MLNVYGELWGDTAVSNRHFSRKYDAGNTTHAVYVNGGQRTHRYLPLIVEFNPYRLSHERKIAIEATCGVDGVFTGSAGGPLRYRACAPQSADCTPTPRRSAGRRAQRTRGRQHQSCRPSLWGS